MARLHVRTSSYVGDGQVSQSITGFGFEPRAIFLQAATGEKGLMKLDTMSGSQVKVIPATYSSNQVTFDADGFTTGGEIGFAHSNTNARTYHYCALGWDDGSPFISAVSYTGDGTDSRAISSGLASLSLVLQIPEGADWPAYRTTGMTGDQATLIVNAANCGLIANAIEGFSGGNFTVGSGSNVNGTVYHVLCVRANALFDILDYTGNGVDNRNITGLACDPDFAFVKHGSSNDYAPIWKMEDMATDGAIRLTSDGTGVETNRIQAFGTGSIQVGTGDEANINTLAYDGFVFQEGTLSGGGGGGGGGQGGGGSGGGNGGGGGGGNPGGGGPPGQGGPPGRSDRFFMSNLRKRRKWFVGF